MAIKKLTTDKLSWINIDQVNNEVITFLKSGQFMTKVSASPPSKFKLK